MMKKNRIPFFGNQREYIQYREELLAIVDQVMSTGQMLQSQYVDEFEDRIARFVGREYAVSVNSCTDALFFALRALGIGEGDEVLVTNFSFVASASAIVRTGARPVFVDIDPYTLNMDLQKAAEKVSRNTRALVWVHLYGLMGNVSEILDFARRYGLLVVEDAAQALGAEFQGVRAGGVGDVSCISFDPTKVVSAPGSGGVVLTDEERIASKVRSFRYHGKGVQGTFDELGYNSQMSSIAAAVLSQKLMWQQDWLERRRAIAAYYMAQLAGLPLQLPAEIPGSLHIYHKFVLRSSRRDELRQFLQDQGVETKIHYALPLTEQPVFNSYIDPGAMTAYPVSYDAARTVLSLPMHPYLQETEIHFVADAIKAFFEKVE